MPAIAIDDAFDARAIRAKRPAGRALKGDDDGGLALAADGRLWAAFSVPHEGRERIAVVAVVAVAP